MRIAGGGGGLNLLNRNINLDLTNVLINQGNDDEVNPFLELTIDSEFYDSDTFCDRFRNSDKPVFLNLNAQSLVSKHEKLKNFVNRLTKSGLQIDVIALQETWNIKYSHLLSIPGFQKLVYKNRNTGRGGGGRILY